MLTTERAGGMPSGWRVAMWAVLAAVLLAPLIAMQLTDEVHWTAFDFGAAAVLFGALGLCVEYLTRAAIPVWARGSALGAAIAAVLVIWADGAVGLF